MFLKKNFGSGLKGGTGFRDSENADLCRYESETFDAGTEPQKER